MLTNSRAVALLKKCFVLSGFLSACVGISTQSHAAAIFSQPVVNGATLRSDVKGDQQLADNFSFSAAGPFTVKSVHWWGMYDNPQTVPTSFSILFFDDDPAKPGNPKSTASFTELLSSVAISSTLLTGTNSSGATRPILYFKANLPTPVSFDGSNKPYYISIVETSIADQWNWSSITSGDIWHRGGGATDPWSSGTANLAFELNDTLVPVPTPTALGGGLVGLAGLALAAKFSPRKKQQI